MNENREASSFVSRQVESSRLFFLDSGDDEEFTVVFGGFERCNGDYRIDRQDFPWFVLEFVNRGTGSLQLGNVNHHLQPGSFFIYGPSLPHRIESSEQNHLGKYFVGFTGSGVEAFFERYGIGPGTVARCMRGEPVRRAFDTLIDRGVRKSSLARPVCSLITRQLLLMCGEGAAQPINTGSPSFAVYTSAREFIEASFLQLNNLEAVAKGCGVEAPYLCRLFAKYHDESPYQFLTRLRMDHASRLLLEKGASVRSVAEAMGFKEAYHFSRVFKAVHHVPPSRFRRSMHPQWPR